jgi:hypothetical protein
MRAGGLLWWIDADTQYVYWLKLKSAYSLHILPSCERLTIHYKAGVYIVDKQ